MKKPEIWYDTVIVRQKIIYYLTAFKIPLLLAAIFVVQNLIFNSWVKLGNNPTLPVFLLECLTLGILLYGPAVLLGKRSRYFYLLTVSLAVSAVFISQYLYFSFYGGFLQASALKYALQAGAEKSTILPMLARKDIVFLVNIIVVFFAAFYVYKEKLQEKILVKKEKVYAGAGIFLVAILGYGFIIASGGDGVEKIKHPVQTLRELNSFTWSPNYMIQERGICNYYFGDIIGMLMRSSPITADDLSFVENWLTNKPASEPDTHFGIAKGKNLIIVQFESLEAAVIDAKVDGQEITPNLNKLAKANLYFNNYYTQVGPGNTADAEFVTLNSLFPLTNTVAFIDFAHNKYTALPALLKQYGYRTYVLHGDVPSFWNRANIYPQLGYDEAISKADFTPTESGFETLPDDDLFAQTLEMMKTFPQPFMATVITLSSHSPFEVPEQYQTLNLLGNPELSDTQKNYLESVHYSDNALGNFIAGLKEHGLYNNSVIAIYGDHGSSTGISDVVGTSTDKTLAVLRPSQVPLIIIVPKAKNGAVLKKIISKPSSHLDFYPTVAALLGVVPPKNIFGQDILGNKTPVITRRDPYSNMVTAILAQTLAYEGADDGVFADGTCLSWPTQKLLPVADCKTLFNQQSSDIKASDLIVHGNLIPKLTETASAIAN